jgi:hypothetical protein
MTRATELNAALLACLRGINPAAGFATDLKGVYGFGESPKDTASLPLLLVTVLADSQADRRGTKVKRHAQYQVEAIFPRSAPLADLQACHYDILRSFGLGVALPERALNPADIIEESAEFEPDTSGASTRALVLSLTLSYIETY